MTAARHPPPRRRAPHQRAIRVVVFTACAVAAAGAGADERSVPTSVAVGYESLRLPGDERMGLVGTTLLFETGPGWWFGPAVYGAARGERGGLFVGGVELQRRWRFGAQQWIAGVFAGGGGGAAAPVGGGLMWRPAVAWLHDVGPLQAGITLSRVRFPSGDIASSQAGVVLAWNGEFRHAGADRVGTRLAPTTRSGLGIDRALGVATVYRLRGGHTPRRRIGLAGARFERDADAGGAWWGIEAAAAASGDAAGYMELLATAGWHAQPLDVLGWRVGARAALGLGGGGAVPTGGGVIARLTATTSVAIAPHWRAGVDAGWLRAADTSLAAPVLQAWIATDLEPARRDGRWADAGIVRTEWSLALQHHARVRRNDGTRPPLETLGLKLNRQLGEHLYLSGQAHTAVGGGAGAYGIGLVGLGAATTAPARGWRVGGEWLVGAAGGGGVAARGGAVTQALLWGAWAPSPHSDWRVGVGAIRSLRGDGGIASPVVELAWTRAFGQAAP